MAHEYFHNWTGNRVTCRDWFQLTLKEGLTVFRDQQFSGDMTSVAVKRIEDVTVVRALQVRGQKLLVYAALSYQCTRPNATSV